jgi:hypothetical protein
VHLVETLGNLKSSICKFVKLTLEIISKWYFCFIFLGFKLEMKGPKQSDHLGLSRDFWLLASKALQLLSLAMELTLFVVKIVGVSKKDPQCCKNIGHRTIIKLAPWKRNFKLKIKMWVHPVTN